MTFTGINAWWILCFLEVLAGEPRLICTICRKGLIKSSVCSRYSKTVSRFMIAVQFDILIKWLKN